jgi:hypothetical protein
MYHKMIIALHSAMLRVSISAMYSRVPREQTKRSDLVVAVVIGLLGVLTGPVLDLLAVNEVKTTALDLAVDEGTGESGEEFLGLGVAGGLAWMVLACLVFGVFGHASMSWSVVLTVLGNVVLVSLGGFVAGGTGDQLVDRGGLVLLVVVALPDLVVRIGMAGVICWMLANARYR